MTITDTIPLWWTKPFRMLQTNLREIDAGMDVEKVLDDIEAHGANAWLVNGGGIFSFYPTDLDFQTRNRFLGDRESGDLLGDAVAAAKRRGVRVLARMDFSKVSVDIGRRHPDWLFVSPDGENQLYNGLLSVCPSAAYYQERAFDVLTELASRYPVDGFFFNWMSYNEFDYDYRYRGACHCAACVIAFERHSPGHELPTSQDDPSYGAWRRFVAAQLDDLTARFRAHINALLPEAALVLGDKADIMFHEANSKVGRDFWPHATSQAVSVSKSYRPEVPVLVNSAVFLDMPYRYAPIGDEHYKMYFVEAISRGAIPSTYTMGPPEAAPYANLPAAGEIMRFHRDHEDLYAGARQDAATLLVRGGSRGSAWWTEESEMEFRGCHEALQRQHIPFDMVDSSHVAAAVDAGKGRYRVIVLADVGVLDPAAVDALDRWVREGGHLVAIGSSGVDGDRVQLATSPADAQVARYEREAQLKNMYVARSAPGVGDGFDRISPVFGEYRFMRYRDDAVGEHEVLAQVPFGPPEFCYGSNPTGYPGWSLRRVGEGSHTVIPWTIGTTARHLGARTTPDLLAGLVRDRGGDGGWKTKGLPAAVEVIVSRTGSARIVHLLNFSGLERNTIGAPIRVAGASLGMPSAAVRAVSTVTGQELTVRSEAGTSWVELADLDLFDAIVLTPPR